MFIVIVHSMISDHPTPISNCSLSLSPLNMPHSIDFDGIHIKCWFNFIIMHSRTIVTSSRTSFLVAANIFLVLLHRKISQTLKFLLRASDLWAHKKTYSLVMTFHYSFWARSILLGELFRRFHLLRLLCVLSKYNCFVGKMQCTYPFLLPFQC